MDDRDDVVVGCITGYNFEAIKPWVNSLDRCGFRGKKVVLCYNIGKEVIDELAQRNYSVLAFKLDENGNAVYKNGEPFSIVVERFFHLWAMLSPMKGKCRYLLHTDVKDVIFQMNPSDYFPYGLDHQKCKIMAASESIRYCDENWGRDNLKQSFGDLMYDIHKDNIIVNAGTLSGDFDTMVDFFLNIYMVSVGARTHNPDQAAVNILLSKSPYKEITSIQTPWNGWACQAGTTNDPNKIGEYGPKLVDWQDASSFLDEDETGFICNFVGQPFYIVHQYDRVPEWKDYILRKYA